MMEIIKRKDGTFVVIENGLPYHVVSKDIYPQCKYELEEIEQYANDNPDMVKDE